MFSGRDALFSIQEGIGRARSDEGRLDAALRSAMDEAARLRGQEAAAFRALARIRLDTMVRDRVIDDLDATERRVLAIVEDRRRHVEELAHRRDEAQAQLEKAETAKHERDHSLADAIEALDELRGQTAERIKQDAAWTAAKAAVDAAEKVAANADKKASLAEADLATKRKPYEDDPIFMYLWHKKHGQAEDTSGALTKFFDRKVARLIGYQDARPNYAMLQEIPARLREHARNKLGDVDAARQHVVEVERAALVTAGIEGIESRVAASQGAAKTAGEAVLKITAELQQIDAARMQASGTDDQAWSGAVDLLAEGLGREDLQKLYQEAVRTPTKADDQAIASIAAARQALQKIDSEVARIRSEMREMARRRSELEGARDRARQEGYDDPRGTLGGGGEVLGQIIGGILQGAMRGAVLDGVFRDNYSAPKRRANPDFGSWTDTPSWPNSWGEVSRHSESGDGGWRTGGGF
jgi:chromosome segregation ATPase